MPCFLKLLQLSVQWLRAQPFFKWLLICRDMGFRAARFRARLRPLFSMSIIDKATKVHSVCGCSTQAISLTQSLQLAPKTPYQDAVPRDRSLLRTSSYVPYMYMRCVASRCGVRQWERSNVVEAVLGLRKETRYGM